MGSLSVTCHRTQVSTRCIPRLNPSHTGRYSIYLPRRDDHGRLSWPRWLVTIPRWFTRSQAVSHPSTNRAQCRLTTLIEANALTTTLRRHPSPSDRVCSVYALASIFSLYESFRRRPILQYYYTDKINRSIEWTHKGLDQYPHIGDGPKVGGWAIFAPRIFHSARKKLNLTNYQIQL